MRFTVLVRRLGASMDPSVWHEIGTFQSMCVTTVEICNAIETHSIFCAPFMGRVTRRESLGLQKPADIMPTQHLHVLKIQRHYDGCDRHRMLVASIGGICEANETSQRVTGLYCQGNWTQIMSNARLLRPMRGELLQDRGQHTRV